VKQSTDKRKTGQGKEYQEVSRRYMRRWRHLSWFRYGLSVYVGKQLIPSLVMLRGKRILRGLVGGH
jgi:hypothetical protein